MLDGYNRDFWHHARACAVRQIDIPDPVLGVGFAENLQSQPIPLFYHTWVNRRVKIKPFKTMDQAEEYGQKPKLNPSDFPMEGYLGGQLGGY